MTVWRFTRLKESKVRPLLSARTADCLARAVSRHARRAAHALAPLGLVQLENSTRCHPSVSRRACWWSLEAGGATLRRVATLPGARQVWKEERKDAIDITEHVEHKPVGA
jgi:hypothetical protein